MDADNIKQINRIKNCDIVIGIPSFNNKDTISNVINAVDEGLIKYYATKKSVIVVSDGNSFDSTYCVANNLLTISDKIVTKYIGIPGKGSAIREIFEISKRLGAKAIVTVDADLRSITPDWVFNLVEPILSRNVDMVTPIYYRNKYDATITRLFVRPLINALFKRDLQQPIGGDFSFSQKFVEHCLKQNVWSTKIAKFGIDIWLTSTAILDAFSMNQAALGNKIHDEKAPTDLGKMFMEVADTLFNIILDNKDKWKETGYPREIPKFMGVPIDVFAVDKRKPDVTLTVLSIMSILEKTLSHFKKITETFLNLESTELMLSMMDKLWPTIVFQFIMLYNKSDNAELSQEILKLFVAFYYGKCVKHFDKVATEDINLIETNVIHQFIAASKEFRV